MGDDALAINLKDNAYRSACGNAMSVSVLMRVLSRLLVHAGLTTAIVDPWDELGNSECVSLTFDKLTGLPCRSDVQEATGTPCDHSNISSALTSCIVDTTDAVSAAVISLAVDDEIDSGNPRCLIAADDEIVIGNPRCLIDLRPSSSDM